MPCHRQHRLFSSLARPVLASFSIWHLFASVPVNQHNCYTHKHTQSRTPLARVPLWKHSTDSLFVIVVDFAFCEPWKEAEALLLLHFLFLFLFSVFAHQTKGRRAAGETHRQTDGRTDGQVKDVRTAGFILQLHLLLLLLLLRLRLQSPVYFHSLPAKCGLSNFPKHTFPPILPFFKERAIICLV